MSKQINFTIVPDDSGDGSRTYANFCAVAHTPFDLTAGPLLRAALPEATAALTLYLARLDAMLEDGRPCLLGPLPSLADFSGYHSLWFIRRAGPLAKELLEGLHREDEASGGHAAESNVQRASRRRGFDRDRG